MYENSGFVVAAAPETKALFLRVAPKEEVQPEKEADRIIHALSRFMLRLCPEQPLILFIDDLQWSDRASVEILHKMLEEKCLCLLLVNFRIEPDTEFKVHDRTLQELGIETHLKIGPFASSDIHQMLIARFGQFEDASLLAEILGSKTDGSPLTISEACRYLVHSNTLMPDSKGWRLNSELMFNLPEKFDPVSLVLGQDTGAECT